MKMNIVATYDMKQEQYPQFLRFLHANKKPFEVNLKKVAQKLPTLHSKLNSNAIELSRTKLKGTVAICKSGKSFIYNCQSIFEANKLARLTIRDINRALNVTMRMTQFKVVNIRAEQNLGFEIDINKLNQSSVLIKNVLESGGIEFEIIEGKKNVVFSSGVLVIWGIEENQIKQRYLSLKTLLKQFKQQTSIQQQF